MKPKNAISAEAGDDAELLAGDGEHEIGVRVGQDALVDALAGAAPEPAARQDACKRGVDLERVADAARDGIVDEEVLHAVMHVRRELDRRGSRPTPPAPNRPSTQNQCSPAMKNSAPQTTEISIVWPKSGCRISGTIVTGRIRSDSARASPLGAPSRPPSVNAQAASTTKAGLMNSDGCTPMIQRREPLTSAPNISAATISANETA